jgi:hypothetical protein
MSIVRPKNIKIGPYTYEISFKDKKAKISKLLERVGETHFQDLLIWVKPGKHMVERETLMHETLHAIFAISGITNRFTYEEEEEIVASLSPYIMMVILDNPEVLEFLLKDK